MLWSFWSFRLRRRVGSSSRHSIVARTRGFVATTAALATLATESSPVAAQVTIDPLRPASSGGLEIIDRNLQKLEVHARLLVVGAHPDDEDTALLAWTARGFGGEAAYLSLSRGEGGQNLLGPDLGVSLGLLRTRELEAARRVDGARQYFTRALDFGYTTSLDETLGRWPRDEVLTDAVRVVRQFRPQVIVSVFAADPVGGGGHGQHQEAGLIAHQAYTVSGDAAFATSLEQEGLAPWSASALYRGSWFDREATTMVLSSAQMDPWSGRSLSQLAMASRGQHRSQDMGRLLELGPREIRLSWVAGGGGKSSTSPFTGIDTRLRAIAALLPEGKTRHEVAAALEKVEGLARAARQRLNPVDLSSSVPALREIVTKLRGAETRLEGLLAGTHRVAAEAVAELLVEKRAAAENALVAALGLAIDASTESELLAVGEPVAVRYAIWNTGKETVRLEGAEFVLGPGVRATGLESAGEDLLAGVLREAKGEVVADSAASASPYFLSTLPTSMYDWSSAPVLVRGQPFAPAPVRLQLRWRLGEVTFSSLREVVARRVDQSAGEVRRPLRVVEPLEVSVEPGIELVSLQGPGDSQVAAPVPRTLRVTLRSASAREQRGQVRVDLPFGWPSPPPVEFILPPRGVETLSVAWTAPAGRTAGRGSISVRAERADGRSFALAHPTIEYAHVPAVAEPRAAVVDVVALDLAWPKRRVGYVRGASDRMPEALASAGLAVELLDGELLRRASAKDLAVYDVIVIGARAYEAEPALASAQLFEFVRAGGELLVQYQQYPYLDGGFAPLPFTIARPHDRVTDEGAAVQALVPGHRFFASPNPLGPADWEGWVQERGLYFAHEWDAAFTPLLAIGAGEKALRGGLLVAPYGKGTFVYTGLAFFRQLPAGVPGAYRAFANLLALGETKKAAGDAR